MNQVLKQVSRYEALDKSLHETEREALIVSIGKLIGCSRATVLENIEPNLTRLTQLLNRLDDPRNRLTKPSPLPKDQREFEEGKATQDGLRRDPPQPDLGDQCVSVFTNDEPVDEGLKAPAWGAAADISIDDLREGQIVEIDVEDGPDVPYTMDIEQITCDNEPQPLIIGHVSDCKGLQIGDNRITCHIDDIKRIVTQPEERLGLDTAKAALAILDAEDVLTPPMHKRRILLLRRIEQLEKDNG